MKWVTVVLGVALFLSPFVAGFSGTPGALWPGLIFGAAIAFLGYKSSYKAAAIVGLLVFLAPWIFGFGAVPAAALICRLLGGAVVLLAGYQGFFGQKKAAASMQHQGV